MATIIGDGSRIDNLVHIGHGANLASGVFVASGAVIGGYANIGKDSFIGMNAAVRQHVCIGAESLVGMNSGVIRNVESKKTVAGFPARAIEWILIIEKRSSLPFFSMCIRLFIIVFLLKLDKFWKNEKLHKDTSIDTSINEYDIRYFW